MTPTRDGGARRAAPCAPSRRSPANTAADYRCGLPVAMGVLAAGAVGMMAATGWLLVMLARALPAARAHGL